MCGDDNKIGCERKREKEALRFWLLLKNASLVGLPLWMNKIFVRSRYQWWRPTCVPNSTFFGLIFFYSGGVVRRAGGPRCVARHKTDTTVPRKCIPSVALIVLSSLISSSAISNLHPCLSLSLSAPLFLRVPFLSREKTHACCSYVHALDRTDSTRGVSRG